MSAAAGRERPVWSEKKLCSFESVVFVLWERFLTAIARVNRGWKPLPPTFNRSLKDIELNVVSHEGLAKKWTSNIERPTSNNEFCQFK